MLACRFPYITSYLHKNGVDVQGNYIVDGVVTEQLLQQDIVVYEYLVANKKILNVTDAQIAKVKAASDKCNYTGFAEKNLHYPPKGKLPSYSDIGCGSFGLYEDASMAGVGKDWNIYKIDYRGPPGPFDKDPLGNPNTPNPPPTFFGRREVQDYLHAPHIKWRQCAQASILGSRVFPDGDNSQSPDKTVLAGVIEKNKRTVISNGQLDGLILTNGTALGLQNLTWANAQGFAHPPTKALIGTDGKKHGTYVNERGLLFAIIDDSGHMTPTDSPASALALLQFMLGRREM